MQREHVMMMGAQHHTTGEQVEVMGIRDLFSYQKRLVTAGFLKREGKRGRAGSSLKGFKDGLDGEIIIKPCPSGWRG